MDMLKSVHIEGFKSIRDATIDLGPLTVLIGANGSGKSNFISFLNMMKALSQRRLQRFVARSGGAETLLHFGSATTDRIACDLTLNVGETEQAYSFVLSGTEDDALVFTDEWLPDRFQVRLFGMEISDAPYGHKETELASHGGVPDIVDFILHWQLSHLHDTSATAAIRKSVYIDDNRDLHSDAGNLAAYLYRLRVREPFYYDRIISAFRLAAPWFEDFFIEPLELTPDYVKLNWRERGQETLFGPHQLSDGSLRTIALLTLLLQPDKYLPPLIVIDEPELGLHPYVVTIMADLVRSVATTSQVVVATQSTGFLNHFSPEEIIVVERDSEGCTTFEQLEEGPLLGWLERYSIGELWEKNVIGGRP